DKRKVTGIKILDDLEQRIERVEKILNKEKEKMNLKKGKGKMVMERGTQDRGCGYLCRRMTSLGLRSALNLRKAECSNCKFLAEKIKALETKIKILKGTLKMERHPKNYTLELTAILHELYNDIGKLGLE
ncbi:hypothetical protein Tco_1301124, partial [Tanacetum coccineum]